MPTTNPDFKRRPGETEEDARLRRQQEWLAAEPERKRQKEAAKRKLNTGFLFWTACSHRSCRRAQACRGDVERCFNRCWPHVPEDVKVYFRTFITAISKDKLSGPEAVQHAKQEVARWRDIEARFAQYKVEQDAADARFAAQQTRARADAFKAYEAEHPRTVPEERAPRIRRL